MELSKIVFDRTFAELSSEIVDQAIEDHEIAARDAKLVRGALAAITLGLAGLGTDLSAEAHQYSVEMAFPRIGETANTDEVLALLNQRN